jgi:hypothetical protein
MASIALSNQCAVSYTTAATFNGSDFRLHYRLGVGSRPQANCRHYRVNKREISCSIGATEPGMDLTFYFILFYFILFYLFTKTIPWNEVTPENLCFPPNHSCNPICFAENRLVLMVEIWLMLIFMLICCKKKHC